MARLELQGIDDLMKGLSQLDVDKIAPIMLDEAAPILEKAVKKRTAVHKDTGALQASIKPTKSKRTGDGYSITVRPTGKDEKGVRNMEKAAYLEYGTSKQAARPFIGETVRAVEPKVLNKMQEVFEREVEKLDNL